MDDHPEATAMGEGEAAVQVFEAAHGYWSTPRGLLIAGFGWILLGLAILFATKDLDLGKIGPIIITGLFSYGLVTLARILGAIRDVRRVLVDDEGVVVETVRGERLFLWTELVHAEVYARGAPQDHYVLLFDRSGRRVAKFAGDIEGFDILSARVKQKVEKARADVEGLVRLKRNWPNALAMIVGGLLISASSLPFAWAAQEFVRDAWRLQSVGVSGAGLVTERYTRRDGREYWITYTFSPPLGGAVQQHSEVEEAFWRDLTEGATVAVRYVPGEPGISALVTGEKEATGLFRLIVVFGLFSFGTIMGVVFFSAGALHLARVDIKRKSGGLGFVFSREGLY